MAGMKAARAFTGRSKIAKVEGSYHGSYDYAEVSQESKPGNWGDLDRPNPVPLTHGTPSSVIEDVIIIPFNEPDKAIVVLDEHIDEIACVIIDPIPHRIGMVPVKAEFAKALREWTTTHGVILMFDEVITYRSEYGGMQEQLDVTPDLTSMGKMIGGGFHVGALAGHADVMGVFTKGERGLLLPHSGTFSANPVTMTAGLVAMELFDRDAVSKINKLGDYTRASLKDVIKTADIPGSVTGAGSLFRIHFKENAPTNHAGICTNLHSLLGVFYIHNTFDNDVSRPIVADPTQIVPSHAGIKLAINPTFEVFS